MRGKTATERCRCRCRLVKSFSASDHHGNLLQNRPVHRSLVTLLASPSVLERSGLIDFVVVSLSQGELSTVIVADRSIDWLAVSWEHTTGTQAFRLIPSLKCVLLVTQDASLQVDVCSTDQLSNRAHGGSAILDR